MSTFAVPQSSSPPSTPGSHQRYANSLVSNPSTTPAGPPPSSAKSFTPAGLPPSSTFGDSQSFAINGYQNSPSYSRQRLSGYTPSRGTGQLPMPKFTNGAHAKARSARYFGDSPVKGFHSSENLLPELDNDEYEDEEDSEDENHSEGSDQGPMEEDSFLDERSFEPETLGESRTNHSYISDGGPDHSSHEAPFIGGAPRGTKRSHGGAVISQDSSPRDKKARVRNKDSGVPILAKNMASQLGLAQLVDSDDLIVRTDALVTQLYNLEGDAGSQERALETALPIVTEGLNVTWRACCDKILDKATVGDYTIKIGPDENAPPLQKALFITSLLLQLRHPPPAKGKQAYAITRPYKASTFSSSVKTPNVPLKPTALPKVLIEWLDDYHHPYKVATANLMTYQPNPTADINYWDLVFSSALRGQIAQVIAIFKRSDFKCARTAREDGHGEDGYQDTQLVNINRVISRAIQLLELCPAVQDEEWNVAGSEWRIFRKRVEQAMHDLATFAEGRDRDMDLKESTFEAPNFGIRNPRSDLSQSARRAESQVPWTIYQNLKAIYGILLGGTTEIIANAQDWVEAALGLTIWWDGDDDDDEFSTSSLAKARRSMRHSLPRGARLVDVNPSAAYLRRLGSAFDQVTDVSDEELFQINPVNPVEVGLASVFEGDVEGTLGLLRGWSLPIAAAVIEVASLGGWFNPAPGSTILDGFNENDLLVLSSYGSPAQGLTKDRLLIGYSDALFEKESLQGSSWQDPKEGWELSVAILTRLDDTTTANRQIAELLSRIPPRSDERVDKILSICQEFGMDREAHSIAEVKNPLIDS